MKKGLTILFLFFSFWAFSQRMFVYGVVKDSTTKEVMVDTHIRNLSSQKLAISDAYGHFRIPIQVGDTLLLSSVGHQQLAWIAEASWFEKERVEFLLPVDTIYLEEVVIGKFPEYEQFKELIVETRPEDTSFWYYGVPRPVMKEHTVLEKKEFTNPLFIASHPITFWHYAFSKKEKEKRKMQQIQKRSGVVSRAAQKFNREWVGEMTKLQGDTLTSFIAYCKFTPEYIDKTPLYIIHEKMMALLPEFLEAFSKS